MDLADLSDCQTRVLVAYAASWRTLKRPPRANDVLRIAGGSTGTVTVLVRLGLLTQDWVHGKRVPETLRPTDEAWRVLGFET